MLGPFPWFRKKEPPIDPAVAAIMQELDDELARDHEMLGEDFGYQPEGVEDVLRSFAQHCQKVALVGSMRRGKPDPGDIDILFIPKHKKQVVEFLEQVCDDEAQIGQLDKLWTCTIKGRKVQFIESTERTWGWDMIQFTGSREFNEKVLRHARRREYRIEGFRPVIPHRDDYHSWNVPAFAGWSEEKILDHLGLLEYLSPHKREGKVPDVAPALPDSKSAHAAVVGGVGGIRSAGLGGSASKILATHGVNWNLVSD